MGFYTGTRLVKMSVKTVIPSHIIAGHTCTVFYHSQVRLCFHCGVSGHEAKKCPQRPSSSTGGNKPSNESSVPTPNPPTDQAPQAGTTPPHPSSCPITDDTVPEEMTTTPPTSPRTFANVVASFEPSSSTAVGVCKWPPSPSFKFSTIVEAVEGHSSDDWLAMSEASTSELSDNDPLAVPEHPDVVGASFSPGGCSNTSCSHG